MTATTTKAKATVKARPGRGPGGGLRNFNGMELEELQELLAEVSAQKQKDLECVSAIERELAKRATAAGD